MGLGGGDDVSCAFCVLRSCVFFFFVFCFCFPFVFVLR